MGNPIQVKVNSSSDLGATLFFLSLAVVIAELIWSKIPDVIWQVSLVYCILTIIGLLFAVSVKSSVTK